MRNEEHYLQVSMVNWFNYQYPKMKYNLFAVPNGQNKSIQQAKYFKSEGLKSGVSDLIFCLNGKTTFIEVKTGKGKQSPTQKEFEKEMEKNNFDYYIVRDLDEFRSVIETELITNI